MLRQRNSITTQTFYFRRAPTSPVQSVSNPMSTRSRPGLFIVGRCGYEQYLNGHEDFFGSTPAVMHLQDVSDGCRCEGAHGDCSGALYRATLNPHGTEGQVWIELPPGAGLVPDYLWEVISALPWSQGRAESLGRVQHDSPHEDLETLKTMDLGLSLHDSCVLY